MGDDARRTETQKCARVTERLEIRMRIVAVGCLRRVRKCVSLTELAMPAPSFTRFLTFIVLLFAGGLAAAHAQTAVPSNEQMAEDVTQAVLKGAPAKVVVIPVKDQIAKPILYVIRRGLKEAIESKADLVIFDMKTPGGSLGATFEILEAIGRFEGATATYVNNEAISAGSFIAAMTDDIYFAPDGIIGAAAPVMATGKEIDKSMKQKIVSYLKARIRSISEGHGYRGQVISAMIDADYELKIGDEVLKEKGELLSLTATEASKSYGDPAQPLLAAGIEDSIDDLLKARFGERGFTVVELRPTWSEDLAAMINSIAPLLMGLGLLGVFIEFKTPGFGVFGILGGVLLAVGFFGHYVAGLSGHEPMLFFVLGVALVFIELLLLPGTVIFAVTGVLMMLGSLVWSMADLWPNEPISITGDVFVEPLTNLLIALVVMVVGVALAWRFLPHGWIFTRLAVGGASTVSASGVPMPLRASSRSVDPLVGRTGVAVTDLFPSGNIEIDGRLLEARVEVGNIEAGTRIVVVSRRSFGLIVEKDAS